MSLSTGTAPVASAADPIRVLVVEDSGVVRAFFRKFIESDPEMKVTATAVNGQVAIDLLRTAQFDIVVLDIQMPVMDGLTALPLIIKSDPDLQVIVASTMTHEGATMTMKCLQAGAVECLAKPTAQEMAGSGIFRDNLVRKVKELGLVTRAKRAAAGRAMARTAVPSTVPVVPVPKAFTLRREQVRLAPEAVAIGSSTGGPQALLQFFTDLKGPLRQPVFVTQHMPPTFTTILAEHIAKQAGLACHEAVDGEVVVPGTVYLAPGNYHMTVRVEGTRRFISLNQNEPENFCRPAVDPMLRSLIECYGRKILVVIFTGMGSDGTKGCKAVVEAGGTVIAQDEATSVVWGMPGSVTKAGLCTHVLPLGGLAREVRDYADRLAGA